MKKIFSFLTVLLFAGSMFATDATLTKGTNGYDATVNGKTAVKVGTSSKGGDMTVTVGEGATSLTLYAAAWKGVSGLSLNITAPEGVTITPASISLTADENISGSASAFELAGEEGSYKFDFTLSGVDAEANLLFETSSAKRCVIWGATYEVAGGGEEEGPTYTVAGSDAAVFGEAWAPANAANDMVKQGDGSYKWEKTGIEHAAGDIEFKVVKDHSWDVAYPAANYILTLAESGVYTITITFEPENENEVFAVATKTADLVVLPKVVLHGNFGGSDWADTEEFVAAEDKKTASLELTLAEGTFNFGFKFDGAWKANGATIDREHNTTSLAEGSGDMSIVADEAGKYTFVYTFETQAVEVTYPAKRIESDAVYALEDNAEVALKNVTVTYSAGANVWVKDAKGALLIYLPSGVNNTFKAGDILAGVAGAKATYKGLVELKPSAAQVAAIVATPGEAPAPEELTAIDADKDMSKFVLLKNVQADGAFAEGTASNLTITLGENTYTLRNNFKNAFTFDSEEKYNVTAIVTYYNALQLYFISAEEQVDPRMKGAYKVGGETPDFASLYDACVAIETNGIKGDVQLLICADLTETENPGLINNTDFAITIRPDKDEDRLIKFTKTTDNEGPSGAFVIGCDKGITFATTTTKNVTIDGFAEGGETRRLTFLTEDGFGSKAGPIIFYGDVSNSAIKNCIVKNTIYHTSTSTYAVTLRTEKNTDKTPVNILIENNLLIATAAYNGQCVYFNGSQKATAAGNPHDIIVRNNELQASTRGIFCYGVKDVLIEGNIFKVNQISGGRLSHGVLGNSAAGVITIRNNKFVELTTVNVTDGDYGIQAITASGGATAWVIENNYFAGFGTGEVCNGKPTKVLGIRCGDSCVIRHNTIYMPALAYAPSTTLMSGNPIGCLYFAGTKQYIAENNLLVSEETVANNSLIRGGLNPNVKNNVFFHKGGNAAVNAAAVVSMTWEEFTAEGANAGSVWKAPEFVDAANGDLAIKTADADLLMPRLEDVLKDITGADRREKTYAGAFEGPEPSPGTGLDAVEVEGVQKIFRNGEVLIIRDGKTYNMMGQIVK